MENKKNKKTPNFFLLFIVVILGPSLYKLFDFETLSFDKPGLAIVYFLVLVFAVYSLIKDYRKGTGE